MSGPQQLKLQSNCTKCKAIGLTRDTNAGNSHAGLWATVTVVTVSGSRCTLQLAGDPSGVISNDQPWEGPVVEAPFMLQLSDI